MTTELIESFPYPDAQTAALCEDAATCIEQVNNVLVRVNVDGILEMGRKLNAVRPLLEGQFGEWLKWRLPWCEETARGWRVLAQRVDAQPHGEVQKFLDTLNRFRSTTAAVQFSALPEPVQQRVVEREAWSWNEFDAVRWKARMEEHLEDDRQGFDLRHGNVLHAIDKTLRDDDAPTPLKEAAQELYQEHEPTFARLADREPAELAVETGIEWKKPDSDRPSAQLVESDGGYWLCRKVGDQFVPVAPVASYLLMWNGEGEPSVLAAFPRTTDGPAAVSWQKAGVDAVCKRLNASTLESRYGKAL